MAKGRTWCISFQSAATKKGDVKIKYKVKLPGGGTQELNGTWQGYFVGMTPDQKATRFFNELKNNPGMNNLVDVSRSGNTVCFRLKDGAPYDDIDGIEVGDQSGQVIHTYDDPPELHHDGEGPLVTARVRFALSGEADRGKKTTVYLGVGLIAPLVRVPVTSGTTIADVIAALVDAFNKAYEAEGFTASTTEREGEVEIPKVPCKLGVRAGADGPAVDARTSIALPEAGWFGDDLDKLDVLHRAINVISARLDLAGLPAVDFADPSLLQFRIRVPHHREDGGVLRQQGPNPFDDTIAELQELRDLLEKLKRGRTEEQRRNLDEAKRKLERAIDGLEKMRDGDPGAPPEGDIERDLRDAADAIDRANPGRSNGALRRAADNLREIARNLF